MMFDKKIFAEGIKKNPNELLLDVYGQMKSQKFLDETSVEMLHLIRAEILSRMGETK